MIGPCRKRPLKWARFAFTALARARTDRSYDHLGRALGNRDHTTMSSAESRGHELMACDPDFQEMFHAADKQIGGAA